MIKLFILHTGLDKFYVIAKTANKAHRLVNYILNTIHLDTSSNPRILKTEIKYDCLVSDIGISSSLFKVKLNFTEPYVVADDIDDVIRVIEEKFKYNAIQEITWISDIIYNTEIIYNNQRLIVSDGIAPNFIKV